MGFQDRDYYRESNFNSQTTSRKQHSALFYLILINVVAWVLDVASGGAVTRACALKVGSVENPLEWYRFLTYGFCHSLDNNMHILCNMLGLFFLGRYVEDRYGKREFLFFYLFSIVLSGAYWAGTGYLEILMHNNRIPLNFISEYHALLVGASGAVTAVTILFALNFPRVTLYLWGILPIPAFLLGIFIIATDLLGAAGNKTNIAHSVHLAGAAFAFIYFLFKFRFCAIFGYGRPRLRVARENRSSNVWGADDYADKYADDYVDDSYGYATASPSEEELREEEEFRQLQAKVDQLLKKISINGMASLTPAERATLNEASLKYRTRR